MDSSFSRTFGAETDLWWSAEVGRRSPPDPISPVSAINRRERSPGEFERGTGLSLPCDAWVPRAAEDNCGGIGAVGQPPCGGVDRGR